MGLFVLLFVAGFLSSFLGGIVGLGGGFILIPALTLGLSFEIKTAIFFSLCSIFVLSVMQNLRNRELIRSNKKWILPLVLYSIVGAAFAAWIGSRSPSIILDGVFGISMIILSFFVMMGKEPNLSHVTDQMGIRRKILTKLAFFISAFLGGLLGIGGGTIHIPAMNRILHIPMNVATRVSFVFIFLASGAALLVLYNQRREAIYLIPPAQLIFVLMGTALGSLISNKLKFSNRTLKWFFSLILIFIGIVKLLKSFNE